jgi:hypothetical protein
MEYDFENSIDVESLKQELDAEKKLFKDNDQEVINNISVYTIT